MVLLMVYSVMVGDDHMNALVAREAKLFPTSLAIFLQAMR
jgi:hypothetical protein